MVHDFCTLNCAAGTATCNARCRAVHCCRRAPPETLRPPQRPARRPAQRPAKRRKPVRKGSQHVDTDEEEFGMADEDEDGEDDNNDARYCDDRDTQQKRQPKRWLTISL
eukprot:6202532-Pleurochrysis_carterae.AAC.1